MEDLGGENIRISGSPLKSLHQGFSSDRHCDGTAAALCSVHATAPSSIWHWEVDAATNGKSECIWDKDNMALILKLTLV